MSRLNGFPCPQTNVLVKSRCDELHPDRYAVCETGRDGERGQPQDRDREHRMMRGEYPPDGVVTLLVEVDWKRSFPGDRHEQKRIAFEKQHPLAQD